MDLRIRTPEGTQKFIHTQGSALYGEAGQSLCPSGKWRPQPGTGRSVIRREWSRLLYDLVAAFPPASVIVFVYNQVLR